MILSECSFDSMVRRSIIYHVIIFHVICHDVDGKHCAETLEDPYIYGLPLPRIPLLCVLKLDNGQTVYMQPIAEQTPRARLTRLLNGHTKIMQGLE